MNLINSFSDFRKYFGNLAVTALGSWVQLGADIDGLVAGDLFGHSVAINAAGDRIVVGGYYAGSLAGYVRVFSWDGSAWIQMGSAIYGESSDRSGWSVSMNAAGDTIAIGVIRDAGFDGSNYYTNAGSVRVYYWSGSNWMKWGADIYGEAAQDQSGWSVSMSDGGGTVAIGAPFNDGVNGVDSGHVRVYTCGGGLSWVRTRPDLDGKAAGEQFGYSVSLNGVGNRIVVGAPLNDNNGVDAGQARVYCWNNVSWGQMGADINGEAAGDQFGYSVSMNCAGTRIIVGAPLNDGNGASAGQARAYCWSGSDWIQMGSDINGEAAGDQFGYSVSMNNVGDMVIIGANLNDGNGASAGQARAYCWSGSDWIQLGADIDGEFAADQLGISVSMNAAGDRIVVGAFGNDGNGADSGHVRVYSLQ
jgi:hypothetical protein